MTQLYKACLNQLPAIMALLVGLCFTTFNILGFDLAFLPGDLADTRFNIYILEHAHQYFFTDNVPTDGYWNAPFMYPQEAIITFSDNLLGTFLIYSLFRGFGADIYLAFQLWMIIITILNFCAANYLFKHLTKNRCAAALGAFVFAFSIALVAQYAHPQTYPRFCIPIAFYFAVRFYETFSVKHFLGLVFFVVFQLYCVVYLGFMLAIPLVTFVLFTLVVNWKKFVKRANFRYLISLIAIVIGNVILLLPLVVPYMNSPTKLRPNGDVLFRKYDEIFDSIPTLDSYFFIFKKSLVWSGLNSVPANIEGWWSHQLFPGAAVFVAVAVILFFIIKRMVKNHRIPFMYAGLGVSCLITFLCYIRFEEFSFYEYLFELPGYNAVRALHRIINVELTFFGLFIAVCYHLLAKHVKWKRVLFLSTLVVLVGDNYLLSTEGGVARFEKNEAKKRLETLQNKMKELEKGSIVAYLPTLFDDNKWIHIDAMLSAQQSGLKCINGYSGNIPNGFYFIAILHKDALKVWRKKQFFDEEVQIIRDGFPPEIEELIFKMKGNPKWLNNLKKQALERGISLEENILKNALWIDRQKKK